MRNWRHIDSHVSFKVFHACHRKPHPSSLQLNKCFSAPKSVERRTKQNENKGSSVLQTVNIYYFSLHYLPRLKLPTATDRLPRREKKNIQLFKLLRTSTHTGKTFLWRKLQLSVPLLQSVFRTCRSQRHTKSWSPARTAGKDKPRRPVRIPFKLSVTVSEIKWSPPAQRKNPIRHIDKQMFLFCLWI